MAFTERELEISNKSYTNKDFAAIYEELLTSAELLSDRFSPTTAVESDPFIVILKLAAFVADKVIYQVDKNLLERFISSCTQEQSMRELTETLGYNMHYYNAAKTDLIFSYKLAAPLATNILIPKYSIVESASKIPYITTIDSYIDKDKKTSDNVPAIQGKIQSLTVLGNSNIQLENLNSNNRLYFPEIMIAENGVFITNSTTSGNWKKVDNLNTQTYGSSIYKFGFDSKRNLPYLEFPDWIADIIGEGLIIDYVVTQGKVGNVAAKELNTIKKRSVEDNISNDNLRVINLSASFSGSDPETLDQSYLGFKKIIGTFDTLVTCRDYANAIYNMVSIGSNPALVTSNVQVSDRRTDINFACDVSTFNADLGVTIEPMPLKDEGEDIMSPFDLAIYAFNPITNTTISAIKSETDGYNNSFRFLDQFKIDNISMRLENNPDEYKSISHTFTKLGNGNITSIQNYYELTATIGTTTKVNSLEQADIISNIYSSLAREFNARKLNFGHEIPFSELLSVIENADARIKSVSLQEPIQTPKIVTRLGPASNPPYAEEIHDIYVDNDTDSDQFKFIVAKNVLAGRASLFEYDLNFKYDYGYSIIDQVPDVKTITTKCNIDAVTANGGTYTLLDNEVIQFLAPSLITDKIYTSGVFYHLVLNSGTLIAANTDYQLTPSDTLRFYYKEKGEWKCVTRTNGEIVNSKKDLKTTVYLRDVENITVGENYNGEDYYALLSGEEVAIKAVNKEELKTSKKCYWITNKPDNEIMWDDNNEYILQENEYFFYSDSKLTSLFVVGSGTKLTIAEGMEGASWEWTCKKDINIDDITLEGLYALNDAFREIAFSETNKLTLIENEILTLTAGDTIKNNSSSGDFDISDNVFSSIESLKLQYKFKADISFKDLIDKQSITDGNWSCRSLLDINCGPELEQPLVGKQTVSYTYGPTPTTDSLSAASFDILKFNILIQRGGGSNLNLGYSTIADLDKKVYPTLFSAIKSADNDIKQTADGMYTPDFGEGTTAKFYASLISGTTFKPYIMIHVTGVATVDPITLPTVQSINSLDGQVGSTIPLNEGINIIPLVAALTPSHWILNAGNGSNTVFIMSPIKYVKGKNPLLGLQTSLEDFISYMEDTFPEQYAKFYSIADLDPSKQIELSTDYKLNHAQAFYDSNNIANKWVLPKIDFSAGKIKIVIARSSTK